MPLSTENASGVRLRSSPRIGAAGDLQNWGLLFVFLVAVRIPFCLTHHIQEDAYITFRTAFHLADFGTYSYNLGERALGVTSVLYGLLVALLRLVFGRFAIRATLVADSIAFVLAAMLLARTLFRTGWQQLAFFVLTATLPVALTISYTGMETPLQVLCICWALYLMRAGQPSWTVCIPIFLLPLIRPDAIAFALLLALLAGSFRRIYGALALLAALAGCASLLMFNKLVEGSAVPITMRAKEISYHPSHSAAAVLHRLIGVFLTNSFTGLIENRFFMRTGIVFFLLFCACAAAAIRQQRSTPLGRIMITILACGILIPLCYVAGGVIFPWYLWTSAWLLSTFACYELLVWTDGLSPGRRRWVLTTTLSVWCMLMGVQWLFSYSKGMEEYQYRAGIGRTIASLARPGDSLLLEPAGYIPFFAGIHTDDEIGLVSERVLDYRLQDGRGWFVPWLREQKPTFVVERDDIWQHRTVDAVPISAGDWQWFTTHYRLVRHFHYTAADYVRNPLLLRLIKGGSVSSYNLFEADQ